MKFLYGNELFLIANTRILGKVFCLFEYEILLHFRFTAIEILFLLTDFVARRILFLHNSPIRHLINSIQNVSKIQALSRKTNLNVSCFIEYFFVIRKNRAIIVQIIPEQKHK